ncbi:MAG: type II toxin-antitoxin system RelE/ParE family toxin [Gallionella sp.]
MIKDFHDEATLKAWLGEFSRRLPNQIQQVARRKLRMIHNAQRIEDLRIPPNNRLEALKGNRTGQWSIRINDPWRVFFVWKDGRTSHVEICDYH